MPIIRIDIGTGEASREEGGPQAPGPEMGHPEECPDSRRQVVPGLREWTEEDLSRPVRRAPVKPDRLWNQAAEDVRALIENALHQPPNIPYN